METAGSAMEENLTVGTRLSAARQAAGMSINDVSQRIKLTAKQIEILENDEFEQLGLVFSRGFVRNYARLVGLDADRLVMEIPNITRIKNDSLNIHDEHIPLGKGLSQYWLIVASITIALMIGVPLFVYHWLSADDIPVKIAVSPKPTASKLIAPMQPQPAVAAAIPAKTQSLPAPATPVTMPAPVLLSAKAADPAVTGSAAATTTATEQLQFQFNQDSWVEIRNSNQHLLLSHLYHAGETAKISTTPPLMLTIGNAANVKLKYNGQPVDITPHAPNTVTRLTLP